MSEAQLDHLEYFLLVGKVIGVALSSNQHLPARFSIPLLKRLLQQALSVEDLRSVDVALYRSIVEYNRGLDEQELRKAELTFTYEDNFFGRTDIVDLLGCGGEEELVETNKDLEKFLKVVANHLMVGRVSEQIAAIARGLHMVVPRTLLKAAGHCFTAVEFGVLIGGIDVLEDDEVNDWEENTDYVDYLSVDEPIRNFWLVVRRLTSRDRQALLRFATGCPHVPARGFALLRGYDGEVHKFSIMRVPTPSQWSEDPCAYPRAHTCFNQLRLPAYSTYGEMERRIRSVLEDGASGFHEGAVAG